MVWFEEDLVDGFWSDFIVCLVVFCFIGRGSLAGSMAPFAGPLQWRFVCCSWSLVLSGLSKRSSVNCD